MALSFNKSVGGAKKSSITSYSYRDGDNEVRHVGDVLAVNIAFVVLTALPSLFSTRIK